MGAGLGFGIRVGLGMGSSGSDRVWVSGSAVRVRADWFGQCIGQELRYWTVPGFFKVVVLGGYVAGGSQGCKIFWYMVLQNVHLHSLLRNGKRSDCPIV